MFTTWAPMFTRATISPGRTSQLASMAFSTATAATSTTRGVRPASVMTGM